MSNSHSLQCSWTCEYNLQWRRWLHTLSELTGGQVDDADTQDVNAHIYPCKYNKVLCFEDWFSQCWHLSLSESFLNETWALAWFKPMKIVSGGFVWFRRNQDGPFWGSVAAVEPASVAATAAATSVCSAVWELRGASLKQEGWKDLATHLHVMPVKSCLQLDLQRKSDISAHCSTSPGGRGLEGRETKRETSRERERER